MRNIQKVTLAASNSNDDDNMDKYIKTTTIADIIDATVTAVYQTDPINGINTTKTTTSSSSSVNETVFDINTKVQKSHKDLEPYIYRYRFTTQLSDDALQSMFHDNFNHSEIIQYHTTDRMRRNIFIKLAHDARSLWEYRARSDDPTYENFILHFVHGRNRNGLTELFDKKDDEAFVGNETFYTNAKQTKTNCNLYNGILGFMNESYDYTVLQDIYHWLDHRRDSILTSEGIRLLEKRYLRPEEPIQFGMLRIAFALAREPIYREEKRTKHATASSLLEQHQRQQQYTVSSNSMMSGGNIISNDTSKKEQKEKEWYLNHMSVRTSIKKDNDDDNKSSVRWKDVTIMDNTNVSRVYYLTCPELKQKGQQINLILWNLYYDLLSMGMLSVSSILAALVDDELNDMYGMQNEEKTELNAIYLSSAVKEIKQQILHDLEGSLKKQKNWKQLYVQNDWSNVTTNKYNFKALSAWQNNQKLKRQSRFNKVSSPVKDQDINYKTEKQSKTNSNSYHYDENNRRIRMTVTHDNVRHIMNPGEACRLMVSPSTLDKRFVMFMERVCTLVGFGVGVGLAMDTIPLHGIDRIGFVHRGFPAIVEKLNSCTLLSLHERPAKVAIYIHVDNDTLHYALELKNPTKIQKYDNIFVGLMLSSYFMYQVATNGTWHLFPGNARDPETKLRLSEIYDENDNVFPIFGDGPDGTTNHHRRLKIPAIYCTKYSEAHKRMAAAGLATRTLPAKDVMNLIVHTICTTGSPYIIFKDHVNRYNNQKPLGPIRTLNLCSEITNFSNIQHSSSCTLISLNMSMTDRYLLERIKYFVQQQYGYRSIDTQPFIENLMKTEQMNVDKMGRIVQIVEQAHLLGFMGTLALNNIMGPQRRYREIGINPLGVYDAAVIAYQEHMRLSEINPVPLCAIITEAIYHGGIHSSINYNRKYGICCEHYAKSLFAQGITQFFLRKQKPIGDWSALSEEMKHGMANSMITAQAPTASTSLFNGCTESVTVPIDVNISRESENGRNVVTSYGIILRLLNDSQFIADRVTNSIDTQINMYKVSAPFVDHSQSTMFALTLNKDNVFALIVKTFCAFLKTGIYYMIPRKLVDSLPIIRETDEVDTAIATPNTDLIKNKESSLYTIDGSCQRQQKCNALDNYHSYSSKISCDSCTL